MLSYKQIISKFQEFADNHFYLKSYGTGEAFQIVEHDKQKNRKYPMMWVEDQPFPFATGSVTYSFRVYFLQQVPTLKNTDPETLEQINVVEAKSDMLQCAQDLMSFWVQDHNYPDLDILKSTLGTPFHDTLMDSLTGFYIDIKLEQGFRYDSCSIPMTGITPPPTPGCDDVLVSFNGTSVTSTPSGDTKAVVVQSDAVGNPQVGTIITDDANNLVIEVPAGSAVTDIVYVRDFWQAGDQETDVGSLGWYKANTNIFDDNQPATGLAVKLDPDDDTKLLTLNDFGNLDRVTNDLGGQNYTDVGGGLTSDGATAGIAVDNYTGTFVVLDSLHAGTESWNDSVTTAQAYTHPRYDGSTYNQMQMLTPKLIQHYLTTDGLSSHIFSSIDNWMDMFHWIMGLTPGGGNCYFWRENQSWSATNFYNSFSRTTVNSGIDLIVWGRIEDYT